MNSQGKESEHSVEGETPSAQPPRRFEKIVTEKRLACFSSIVIVLLVLLPLAQNIRSEPRDCFPLSYYPMFSSRRDDDVTLRYVIGMTAQGKRKIVPYWVVGRGGMNQTRKQIRNAVKRGEAYELCESVARNVARRKSCRYRSLTHVAVVTAKFRLSEYIRGNTTPDSLRIEAKVPVDRSRR